MKKIIVAMTLLAMSLSACGSASSTPAMNSSDVQVTARAGALTVVAQTQAAIPTDTLIPPMETLTQTPLPTNTPEPSPTPEELASPTAIASPTEVSLLVTQTNTASGDPCNKPLTSWQGPTTNFFINYEYKPLGKNDKVVLSLFVVTDRGECGYLADTSQGPIGQYIASAFVDGKKDFKVFGGFRINGGNWRIIIRNDVIVAKGSCYPNC